MPRHKVVARYFEIWNTGESSIAPAILHPDWIDHATHPEVTRPDDLRQAFDTAGRPSPAFISASQPSSAQMT